jgi:hypothetical protein
MSAMVLPLYLHLQIKKMKIKIKPKHSQIYRPRILQFRKLKKERNLPKSENIAKVDFFYLIFFSHLKATNYVGQTLCMLLCFLMHVALW